MKKTKNSKFKNTGIIFELLTRRLTIDTLNENDSKVIDIINNHFRTKNSLVKELHLYQILTTEKCNSKEKAEKIVDAVIKARKNLSENTLKKQKYNLIKDIKESYGVEDFFKLRIGNYKTFASIYKLFEYIEEENPVDIVNSKEFVVESMIMNNDSEKLIESKLENQDKDVKLLTFKILVDSFNKKYSILDNRQKELLRNYINSAYDNVKLKEYINTQIPVIKKEIAQYSKNVTSKIIRIKLNEVKKLIDEKILTEDKFREEHVLSLLQYYSLINELKNVGVK